jgi:hypothetical protein
MHAKFVYKVKNSNSKLRKQAKKRNKRGRPNQNEEPEVTIPEP